MEQEAFEGGQEGGFGGQVQEGAFALEGEGGGSYLGTPTQFKIEKSQACMEFLPNWPRLSPQ